MNTATNNSDAIAASFARLAQGGRRFGLAGRVIAVERLNQYGWRVMADGEHVGFIVKNGDYMFTCTVGHGGGRCLGGAGMGVEHAVDALRRYLGAA